MIIYTFELSPKTTYKALELFNDGMGLALDMSSNLEYCQWFIDNTKRI